MEKQDEYVIVYTETDFYDPHGSPDSGGSSKGIEIIKNGDWENSGYTDHNDEPYKDGVGYNDDGVPSEEDDTEYYDEDGYNCEVTTTTIRRITKDEYEKYEAIINCDTVHFY